MLEKLPTDSLFTEYNERVDMCDLPSYAIITRWQQQLMNSSRKATRRSIQRQNAGVPNSEVRELYHTNSWHFIRSLESHAPSVCTRMLTALIHIKRSHKLIGMARIHVKMTRQKRSIDQDYHVLWLSRYSIPFFQCGCQPPPLRIRCLRSIESRAFIYS